MGCREAKKDLGLEWGGIGIGKSVSEVWKVEKLISCAIVFHCHYHLPFLDLASSVIPFTWYGYLFCFQFLLEPATEMGRDPALELGEGGRGEGGSQAVLEFGLSPFHSTSRHTSFFFFNCFNTFSQAFV